VIWSFVYLAVRSLFALVVLLGRSDRSKDLEILVLRHELVVLRRRSGHPRIRPADRALLATLSRALPRRAWAAFSVRPETLSRWHRGLVARRWTYPYKKPERPPLARPRRELILRLARENPHWVINGSRASSRVWGLLRTARSDCLDRVLILGRRHLDRVLRVYSNHYNGHARTARSSSPLQTVRIQTSSGAIPPRLASTGTTCSAD
jgi:hypothetical protein